MIRAYGKINGSTMAVERLTIHVSTEDNISVAGQTVTVKNPHNNYIFYEGIADGNITVKIPLGITYEISITEMPGYSSIAPVVLTATEKARTIYLNYEKMPPVVGDFVYTDGSWSGTYKPDKTCVGICFYVNGDDRRMVALTRPETGSGSNPTANLGNSSCYWGSTIPEGVFKTGNLELAKTDMGGKVNTDFVLAIKQTDSPVYNNVDDYPAANFCNNFMYGNKGKGSWWLPACGELYHILQNNKIISQNIVLAGGTAPGLREYFWSSTEYNANFLLLRARPVYPQMWIVRLDEEVTSMGDIYSYQKVLPVTNF